MRNNRSLIFALTIFGGRIYQTLGSDFSSSEGNGMPTDILIILCSLVLCCVWLGCIYFMANRQEKAIRYLQRQLDELWLLQAKPSVWPHAPFIPNPREENPPEYVPPMDPQERETLEREAEERAAKARAFLEARNNGTF